MAKKGVIALMACVFALCLALVGCGGESQEAKDSAFKGTWDLVEMSQDGEITGSEDLETLKSMGLEVFVNFNDDGTMVLALFGDPIEGTWTAESTKAGKIEMEGQTVDMSITDGKLTWEQSGSRLTFEKGEARDAPSKATADESEMTANGEETAEAAEAPEAPETTEASEASAPEAPEVAEAADSAEAAEADKAEEVADEAAPAEEANSESSSSSSAQ